MVRKSPRSVESIRQSSVVSRQSSVTRLRRIRSSSAPATTGYRLPATDLPGRGPGNRGVALILVLWILLALVLLAAGVGMMARTEAHVSRNYADVIRCKWAARAGIYAVLPKLESLVQESSTYLSGDDSAVTSEDTGEDLGDCAFSVTVEDEASKINVNTVSTEVLYALTGSTDVADCIIDWRDSDSTAGPAGAESEYYQTLAPPYNCKNSDYETLGELRLVKGVTEDVLHTMSSDGEHRLADLLTVYKQSEPSGGSEPVDIQSAGRQSLQSVFSGILNRRDVDAIIRYRQRNRFQSKAEIVRVGLSRSKVMEIYDRISVSGEQTQSGKVNMNTAPPMVLALQPGMDESTARLVDSYRTDNGAFDSVGDLLAISELTDDTFVNAAPYFTTRSRVFKIVSEGSMEKTGAAAAITCVVEFDSGNQAQIRYWQE